jgi:hypothetical protein
VTESHGASELGKGLEVSADAGGAGRAVILTDPETLPQAAANWRALVPDDPAQEDREIALSVQRAPMPLSDQLRIYVVTDAGR